MSRLRCKIAFRRNFSGSASAIIISSHRVRIIRGVVAPITIDILIEIASISTCVPRERKHITEVIPSALVKTINILQRICAIKKMTIRLIRLGDFAATHNAELLTVIC
jgi:hypothetical protein